ncbi:MAG TPA: DNA-directed RNA polymerase subunit alpha [Thermotogota bacterium]|nr:DNA-directed RNA polymerase subunit alpha [Thermotogota bacterium]HRW91348.1 DNA-directed RNA polymerase subunit alpha [Thermotogota bacterium]
MIKYVMPKGLNVEEEREEGNFLYGRFSFAPMEKGFATTIGNSLRRVLLSSIMSLAITRIKIPNKFHEYDTLSGVREDILEIIMNIKKIQIRPDLAFDKEIELVLKVEEPGIVTAAQIESPAGITITNPEQKIATLDQEGMLEIHMYAEMGKGYVPVAEQEKPDDIQVIPIDGIFSPVVRVNFREENVRVEKKTDYDKLILEIWTKKNISPKDALRISANILIKHFHILEENLPEPESFLGNFPITLPEEWPGAGEKEQGVLAEEDDMEDEDQKPIELEEPDGDEEEEKEDEPEEETEDETDTTVAVSEPPPSADTLESRSIEDLGLSVRSLNCLKRDKINTIGDLLSHSVADLLKIRNFGQKSLDEVREKLQEKYSRDLEA